MAQEMGMPRWWRRWTRWRPTSHAEAQVAERALLEQAGLEGLLLVEDVPVGPRKQDFIHTVSGSPSSSSSPGGDGSEAPALVVLPGYAQGSGYWFRSLRGLAAGFRLFALDHLGTGMSGRPPFRARSRQEAEDFFVSSLEAWRERQGLECMILLGHSLGGYLSVCYALKYPHRVKHLVLVGCAGVGNRPADWAPKFLAYHPWSWRGMLVRLAISMWDWGVTPGVIVRAMGPLGPRFYRRLESKRYRKSYRLSDEEGARFAPYIYHITAGRGSGEFALRHLLAPFAWPRLALEDRVEELPQLPITFIYGENDWIDSKGAERLVKALRVLREPLSPSDLQVVKIPAAGHCPYLDQPALFLRQVAQACEAHLSPGLLQAVLAEADALPVWGAPAEDEAADMAEDMRRNPVAAEAHAAIDM